MDIRFTREFQDQATGLHILIESEDAFDKIPSLIQGAYGAKEVDRVESKDQIAVDYTVDGKTLRLMKHRGSTRLLAVQKHSEAIIVDIGKKLEEL